MMKAYIDKEELERLFTEYAVPYTNILDELPQHTAREVAGTMSVTELRDALDSKDEVFATQVWQKQDIYAAISGLDLESDEDAVAGIMLDAGPKLEDCSDNWERLHAAVRRAYRMED